MFYIVYNIFNMNYTRMIIYGFFIWLIPFIISAPFYTGGSDPVIDESVLSSLLIILFVGVFLVYLLLLIKKYPIKQR